LPEHYLPQVGARVQTRRASEWIERNHEKDFFLWLQYFEPHMAYGPPADYLPPAAPPQRVGNRFADASRVRDGTFAPDAAERTWIRELYAGEVRYLDTEIAALFETLRRLDLYDDALIVFTSDHGEELWEHESFEHGHTMYDEVLKVPLLVKLPGAGSARGPIQVPVSTESVTPTVLAVANLLRDPQDFTAPTLVRPTKTGFAPEVAERSLVSSAMLYFEDRTAIVDEGFKYVRFHVTGREQLFDLNRDPGEHHDLAARKDERLERGRTLLEEHLELAERKRERLGILGPEAADLDAETLRSLRGLGYVR
jgi:arylsulfatase A-like enzyme